ncbi:phospholipase [Geotalea uraniireducens]|uniref:Phospholipase n=1 Tax=Geotalea uraniireducens TaxID=351604 RepID=A0ABN6VWL1_9BACT|nr:patatin-like phospholipase family protein [Geotalea uraniireducens]BDV44784.1 phospholipase [Geotalea uraniireducens]
MEEQASAQPAAGIEPITLLLVGGGIRFPAFIGALQAVEQMGVPIRRIIGASTGAIVAALYAAGFSPDDIQRLLLETDTGRFRDFKPRGLLRGMGFCAGDVLEQWLDERLGGRTLGEAGRVPLGLVATDILNHSPHLLTADSCPGLKISTAVRFSAGIPLVFTWKKFVNRGREHIFIDGSLMANVVETQCAETGRTLVIKTFSRRSMGSSGSSTLTFRRYGADLLTIFSHAMDREFLKGGRWRDTITIHCGSVAPISFSLSDEEKAFLFEQGYQQTVKYLRYKWGL